LETALKNKTFVDEIAAIPGGENIRVCIQCGTCTASCPNAEFMDHAPSELIAMARAGMKKEVLASNAMWFCLSCYLCTVRCPRDIKITRLMHVFEGLAADNGSSNKRTTTPVMYRGFNNFVHKYGRMSELWMMMRYYFQTNPFKALKMLPVAWSLFTHQRISVKIGKISPEGIRQLKAITGKAEPAGGSN
jgi:heterodisulfide reductase subunit C